MVPSVSSWPNSNTASKTFSVSLWDDDSARLHASMRCVNLIIIILAIKFVYEQNYSKAFRSVSADSLSWLAGQQVCRLGARYDIHPIACFQAIKTFTRSCGNTSPLFSRRRTNERTDETTNRRKMSEIDLELSKPTNEQTKQRKADCLTDRNLRGS